MRLCTPESKTATLNNPIHTVHYQGGIGGWHSPPLEIPQVRTSKHSVLCFPPLLPLIFTITHSTLTFVITHSPLTYTLTHPPLTHPLLTLTLTLTLAHQPTFNGGPRQQLHAKCPCLQHAFQHVLTGWTTPYTLGVRRWCSKGDAGIM